MRARINSLTYDRKGNPIISLLVVEGKSDAENTIDGLLDKEVDVTIKQYRKRRSIDANAYAWVLIGKIAEKISSSPNEVYQHAIREIAGNYDVVELKSEALETFRRAWTSKGAGWLVDVITERPSGFTDVMCWYGSSVYNSAQMAALIDRLIDDAKQFGIETLTPYELQKINNKWGSK